MGCRLFRNVVCLDRFEQWSRFGAMDGFATVYLVLSFAQEYNHDDIT